MDAAPSPSSNARQYREIALILLLATAMRLLWLDAANALVELTDLGEATHVALALASQGKFADAFYAGQGPTAHMLPISVSIASVFYWLFGAKSAAANVALGLWSIAQTLAGFLAARLVATRIGVSPAAQRVGLVALAVSPAMLAHEAADFRVWEGALAACLAMANLAWLLLLDRRSNVSTTTLIGIAALAAITFFVSPPAGLAIDACWGVFALRRLGIARGAMFATISALVLALLVVPWGLRNAVAMGEPVWLRSNLGLEIAVANHDAALSDAPPGEVFNARMKAIHPYNSPAAAVRLRAEGEVGYSHILGAKTWLWITAHPVGFARLTLRHYREFYVPEPWQFEQTIWRNWVPLRAGWMITVALLGLTGLALGLWRRQFGYGYLTLYVAVTGLPYAIVQPVPRYSYLVYDLFTFLAAGVLVDLWRRLRYREATPGMAR